MSILRVVTIEYGPDGAPVAMKACLRDELDREVEKLAVTQSELNRPCAGDPQETWSGALGWLADLIVQESPGYRRGAPAAKQRRGRLRGAWAALMGRE